MENKKILLYSSILVALLNLFDGITTYYGIVHNLIEEVNPLMEFFMTISPLLFLWMKVVLSILLICVSYLVYQKSKATFQKRFLYSLVGVSIMYMGLVGMHIFWLSFLYF